MPVQSAFARQITYVNYFPSLNYIFEFETEFNNAVESALRGTKSPQEALDIATANVNKIIGLNPVFYDVVVGYGSQEPLTYDHPKLASMTRPAETRRGTPIPVRL